MIDLRPAITLLSEKTGIDFLGYADSSLNRRIERFMGMQKIQPADFLNYIESLHAADIGYLVNELSVNTTEFYRDPTLWKFLSAHIIPELGRYNNIRVWHAGCSTGQEVISSAILFAEHGLSQKVKILASDINSTVMTATRAGCYTEKEIGQSLENIQQVMPEQTFKRYMQKQEDVWKVNFNALPEITLRKIDLTSCSPFSKFDLIFCRNVMIYFNAELQNKIVGLFAASLFKHGLITTGNKENLSFYANFNLLTKASEIEKIYRLKA